MQILMYEVMKIFLNKLTNIYLIESNGIDQSITNWSCIQSRIGGPPFYECCRVKDELIQHSR